jgi:hypothetical protein
MTGAEFMRRYADMCDAALSDPEHVKRNHYKPEDIEQLRRHHALIRSVTSAEVVSLLKEGQLPERLPEMAFAVGLPVETCKGILSVVRFNLTEGLRFAPPKATEPDA